MTFPKPPAASRAKGPALTPTDHPRPVPSVLRDVATFWHGPALARLDIACLRSFVAAGFHVSVYGYEPIEGLPEGVVYRDAAQVVDRKYLFAFVVHGKPSLAHFSDLFRYSLFTHSDAAWIDTDLFCIEPFDIPATGNYFARETPTSINAAILHLDMAQPALRTIVADAIALGHGREIPWGATGPRLITKTLGAHALETSLGPEVFFPVPWDEWWKPFLPSYRDECEALCVKAHALHLWNNIVERSGYWKDLAPPAGSYLHALIERAGCLDLFVDVCPATVMEHLALNYRNSRSAAHLTVNELVKITVPRAFAAVRKRLS